MTVKSKVVGDSVVFRDGTWVYENTGEPVTMEENESAPRPDKQELLNLNGREIWVDKELVAGWHGRQTRQR